MIRASRQDGSYPRPQLVRERWKSLDGKWGFAHDDANRGLTQRWFAPGAEDNFQRAITVPFAPESAASGIDDPGFHPIVWYRLELDLPEVSGMRRLLHFGAIDHSADVWVDGTHVGRHSGGQTSFSFDVTDALDASDRHIIVVRAYDDPADSELPRGKQDWQLEPHFIWYRRSTGIWKSVWLEDVAPVHIGSVRWDTDRSSGTVRVIATLLGLVPALPDVVLGIDLHHDQMELASQTVVVTGSRVEVTLHLPALRNAQQREAYQWSPENPVLIDASLQVRVQGVVVDEAASYLGIRSAGIGGGWFLLNGLPYFVRSVLEQGYWTDSLFTAPENDAYRAEVELIKALGFNAARIHQKVEDPRFLYWADRLGLLIWAETGGAYEFTARAATALMIEWAEIVDQQRSHPSVVTWVPINESWGVQDVSTSYPQRQFVQAITSFTRALDPSRPVVSNDGWEHVDSDILSIHDYTTDASTLAARYSSQEALAATLHSMGPQGRRPTLEDPLLPVTNKEIPVMVTEFGGISFAGPGTWGYAVVETNEAYRLQVEQLFDALRASPIVRGYCYTQLTDTLQESNGMLYANRTPKLPPEELRRIVTGDDPGIPK